MTLKQVIEALVFASPKPITTKEIVAALRAAGEGTEDTEAKDFATAKEANVADIAGGTMSGQLAVVTGQRDISGAAKILKNFQAEFDKPKIQFGYMNNARLETAELQTLADLPSIEVLRSNLLGMLQAPASTLAFGVHW